MLKTMEASMNGGRRELIKVPFADVLHQFMSKR